MLATFQQIARGLRSVRIKKKRGRALEHCPQKRGLCR